jgi:hypothetical protein
LLADMVFPGGLTVVEVGLDHYLLDRNLDAVTAGLVAAVINRSGGTAPITLPVADR